MPEPVVRVIVTGEYPPLPGGVSDHSRQLARGLAVAGAHVHVITPANGSAPADPGVSVHHIAGGFGLRGLGRTNRVLKGLPSERRLLVQYVPHAFGLSSMNVPFCAWLSRRTEPMDLFLHEVAFPLRLRSPPHHNFLAMVHRLMAVIVTRRADRVFVSTAAWIPLLRSLGLRRDVAVLPIPSNLPTQVAPSRVSAVRAALDPTGRAKLIGHFGTYGGLMGKLLAECLPPLLASSHRIAVLVGRGSEEFVAVLAAWRPELSDRVRALGGLPPEDAALGLAACDVLLQPYPDGVTTRRTSLMAGLALGVPVVSNRGDLTEPLWAESEALALCDTAGQMVSAAEALLTDPARQRRLGSRGAALYRERFQMSRTIEALLSASS